MSTDAGGVGWIPARLNEHVRKYGGVVAYDAQGPGEHLAKDIVAPTVGVGNQGLLAACSELQHLVDSGLIRVRFSPHLEDAIGAASVRVSGDRWAWVRRSSSVNVAPLMALTLAACADTSDLDGVASWVR